MFDREITIRGKYATYMKALCQLPPNASEADKSAFSNFKIFDTYISAYMVAPIIGMLNGKKSSYDTADEDTKPVGMLEGVLIKNASKLKYIYRLIVLMDDSEGLTDQEKIRIAFQEDNDDKAVKKGMELYTSYFFGGLEILYETFVTNCITDDDYIVRMFDFVNEFKEEQSIDGLTVDIESLLKETL